MMPLVLAHAGHEHALPAFFTRWTGDSWTIAALVAATVLYAVGSARVPVGRLQRAAFALGIASIVVALLSPIDALADVLFSAHMGQHELLMLVSAPLFVFARTLWVWLWALPERGREAFGRFATRSKVKAAWHALSHPLTVVALHAVAIWAWHLPSLYEAALKDDGIHAVQHACFFVSAALFWWSMVYGRYGRAGYGLAVLYVFLTGLHTGALGALATFARTVWYPTYAGRAEAVGADALADQQLAGIIMWIPAGVVLLAFALGLFAAWLGEASRRAALMDTTAAAARARPAAPRAAPR